MSQISLNFFGETIQVENPKSLSSLRSEISQLFCLSSQDAAEIILSYKDKGETKIIENDADLKTFLKSEHNKIDLDISQNSQLYKQNLNKLKEENVKDKNALESLIKKRKELNDLKETKFASEKKELKEIESKIFELFKRKNEVRKKIFEGMRQIDKELKENEEKIKSFQKKLGIKEEKNIISEKEKEKQKLNFKQYMQKNRLRFAPPFLHPPIQPKKVQLKTNPHQSPHVHPCFFERKYHIHPNRNQLKTNPHQNPNKKNQQVKFAEKAEIIDIPKDSNKTITITESTESNNDLDLDLKMKTIEEWGKCLLLKTQEITNKLSEKFMGLETLKISPTIGNEEKKEEIKTEKNLKTSPNKRVLLKSKSSGGIRPEGVPKKMDNYKMNSTKNAEKVEKKEEKIMNKIVHFGVKCDQCKKYPIVGVRYKCSVCHNFDYCEDCEKKFSRTHKHAFFKINDPSQRALIFTNIPKK